MGRTGGKRDEDCKIFQGPSYKAEESDAENSISKALPQMLKVCNADNRKWR